MSQEQITLYNESNAAKLLSISKRFLQDMRRVGAGPNYKKLGKIVRYSQADLESYLDRSTVVPVAKSGAGL